MSSVASVFESSCESFESVPADSRLCSVFIRFMSVSHACTAAPDVCRLVFVLLVSLLMHVNEDSCLCSGSDDCSGAISAAAGETTALTAVILFQSAKRRRVANGWHVQRNNEAQVSAGVDAVKWWSVCLSLFEWWMALCVCVCVNMSTGQPDVPSSSVF